MQSSPIISFILATIRPKKIIEFLDNFNETAEDPRSFEVLIKIDEGADELAALLETHKDRVKFSYNYFILPKLKKYYSLHKGYDYILSQLSPSSRVAGVFTDEVRMQTKGWDSKIKKYLGHYADDLYRLKTTKKRARNYYNYDECINLGDSYCYFSSTWLNLTGGWGEFWAPDTWHQCLDYHIGLCRTGIEAKFRSMPIFDLDMEGIDPAVSMDGKFEIHKVWMNINGCHILESHLGRENFFRLAHRLYGYSFLYEKGVTEFIFEENYRDKTLKVFSAHNPSLYYEGEFSLPLLATDTKTEKMVRQATPLYAWEQAQAEVNNRGTRTFSYDSKKPVLLASGSAHIEFLMDSLKNPNA